jgi:hypothetical protein
MHCTHTLHSYTTGLVALSRATKDHAIKHQRACICLIGHERMTKDLRALLVATCNLDLKYLHWLPTIGTETLCKEIARWL